MRIALAFLTRLPGGRHPSDPSALGSSVPWFPVVGLLVGGIGAVTFAAASTQVSPLVAAALTLAVTAAATGGFHEDGLADTFDALGGGRDREHRLQILKDSRLGTFGVLALMIVTLAKAAALAELTGWSAATALLGAHCFGRACSVGLMAATPAASPTGLGADYAANLSRLGVAAGLAVGLASVVLAFADRGPWPVLIALAVPVLTTILVGAWARSKIEGMSGDVLGAAEQLAETGILVAASTTI